MTIEAIQIPTGDGTADGFLASPDAGGDHPGVLLYADAIGLRPVIERMADQLANAGYHVLAPNPFYRNGPAVPLEVPNLMVARDREALFARLRPRLAEVTVPRLIADATAYLDFLATRPDVTPGPIGVVGYCVGGVYGLRTATAFPDRVAALAAFHPGALVTDSPDSPHRRADGLAAACHFAIPTHDEAMTPEAVRELVEALTTAGARFSVEFYPDTVHGFTMADTSVFSPSGLDRHWDRLLALFSNNLGTP
ncbi:dienelactone hydrolase family protein [Nocardia sp. NPDC050406]|uniref:dienelactone hydrolase family protein n=1 Tax=Nocardia sp. NPDC050406 TaxID=3364318 RepID=UPI0037B7BA93